jgi:hypothetical protein
MLFGVPLLLPLRVAGLADAIALASNQQGLILVDGCGTLTISGAGQEMEIS